MRLGTWNCQTGLDSNWGAVEALSVHVIAIQECAETAQAAEQRGWTCEWQPGRWEKGQAVIARSPYRIESRKPSELLEPFVSTVISGPDRFRFRFVGFWAMTPKDAGYSYPRQATRLIEQLPDDELPTVVAGDFNAQRSLPHLRNVKRLADRGLVSAYHAYHGADQGVGQVHPTSYYRWQRSSPHHMDFVFVPKAWLIESVEVGTFEDYPGRRLSDHVPVVVSVSPGQSSPGS